MSMGRASLRKRHSTTSTIYILSCVLSRSSSCHAHLNRNSIDKRQRLCLGPEDSYDYLSCTSTSTPYVMPDWLRPWARSISHVSSYGFTFNRVLHCRRRFAFSARMGGNLSSQRANILPSISHSFSASSPHRKLTTSRYTPHSKLKNTKLHDLLTAC